MAVANKVHVKTGDEVVVLTGKDKGKRGKVKAVLPDKNRVVVEGVNMVKRHRKPGPRVMQGGIIEQEAPIHASNVMSIERIKEKEAAKKAR
jgi:large subunit ribosomal protein L24